MIRLIKSTFYKESETKKELIKFIKNSEQLSFGKQCEGFEKKFGEWQGRKYTIFVNSGSSANLAIIQALINQGKLKKNDLVGFSALTWSTNVMPLLELGLQAIPIDVEIDTLNVSSKLLLKTLEKFPLKVLLLTNLLGFCDDIDEIRTICKKEKIILIEDNCESLGSKYKGKLLGNFGLASTFSFYVGHHLSTIEGGAICTDNENLASMLRIVRAHGWDRNLSYKKKMRIRSKHQVNASFYSRYTFYDNGYNLRPTEVSGFIGKIQTKYIDEITKRRQSNFLKMANAIYKYSDLFYPIRYSHMDFISNFAFPIICKSKEIRNKLVEACTNRLEIRPIVGGDITQQPFFVKNYPKRKIIKSSKAYLIHEQGLYCGNNPELTQKEVNEIISIFSSIKA